METADGILNFSFSPASMQVAAKNLLSISISQQYELRINKLKELKEKLGEGIPPPPVMLIPQVFRKFKTLIKKGSYSTDKFDKRELRTLTYSLSHSENNQAQIFSNVNEMNIACNLLEAEWRDSYLIGLLDCYLRNWGSNYTASFERLGKFIHEKVGQYTGGRTVINSFKTNLRFFDGKNGDVLLGSELALKGKLLNEATRYLSLPDNWLTYSYFSKVIYAYYEKKKNNLSEILDEIETSLTIHQSGKRTYESDIKKTSKRVISRIIIQANDNKYAYLQDRVKRLAFNLIGDPSNSTLWNIFDNATESEKEDLRKARIILNEWITRQFINVFFEKCINDPRRKKFWLRYASKISAFKVYGSTEIKKLLKRDQRIEEYVDGRFETVYSNRSVSAFIIYMENYLLIEFSEEGYAFNAYIQNGSNTPNLRQKLSSVDELRNSTMPLLVTREYEEILAHNPEGRLFHKDGKYQNGTTMTWETIFDRWITNYISIHV